MFSRQLIGGCMAALVAAGAIFSASIAADAAMAPISVGQYATPDVHSAWCAVGAHIGPLGACIGGPGWGPGYHRHCWHTQWGRWVCN